jgi:hypothetical protein
VGIGIKKLLDGAFSIDVFKLEHSLVPQADLLFRVYKLLVILLLFLRLHFNNYNFYTNNIN